MPSARDKLNFLYLVYCLGVGGLVGFLIDSSLVAIIAALGMIVIASNGRFIR